LVLEWQKKKEILEKPIVDHLKFENDRKAAVLDHVKHHFKSFTKHINTIDKSVQEFEVGRAAGK